MKILFKLLALLLVAFIGFHVWMNWPVRLAVPDEVPASHQSPPSQTDVTLTVLRSGHIESLHAMSVRGGDWQPYNAS